MAVKLAPETNRAYSLGFAALILVAVLCGIVLYQKPEQWSYILTQFMDYGKWIVITLVGGKALEKSVQKFIGPKGLDDGGTK